jgi:pyruvate dehydrogenase E2 component (dihydrolipoamide acetyltransferase)
MASVEVKLPDIGEGVNEGEVVRWLVKEGDPVKHDQPLLEVMTDKATVEIPCSTDGKVLKLLAKEGQIVKVGGPLLLLESGAGAGASKPAETTSSNGGGKAAMPATKPAPAETAPSKSTWTEGTARKPAETDATKQVPPPQMHAAQGAAEAQSYQISPPPAGAHVLATPATRRYAREAGVDLNQLRGTGPAGRITRDDVMKVAGQGVGAVAAARPQIQPGLIKPPMAPNAPMNPQSGEERKPLRGIRRKIAENLQRSKQIIPHFTHVDEADVTELVAWRSRMKDGAAKQGVKLTYLPFIMKAVVAACREFPQFNSSIDDAASELVYKHYFNVGFAADTAEGLLVPNVKNVEQKNILQLAHEISELAEKARNGKLGPDDMRHGSITITNIGSVGGIYATPIINHPETAIIGIYSIQKKPVVVDGEIKIRDMMNVTATCDHRMIDGANAARYLKKLIGYIENPDSLLLEMI